MTATKRSHTKGLVMRKEELAVLKEILNGLEA